MQHDQHQYITTGEFSRWADDDREWKRETLAYVIDTRERVAKLEGMTDSAANAEHSATVTKRWAVFGGTLAAIINGFLLVFNNK